MNAKEQVSRDELFLTALLLFSSLMLIVCS
jgi:hypothetical protein